MARVPGGSSLPSKKTPTATKTPAASATTSAATSATTANSPSRGLQKITPTVVQQESLQVKIPYTEEGKVFLAKLQELLGTRELPFKPVCSPRQTTTDCKDSGSGGSTYVLEMRIEQEGYPPF